jgi:regulator of nucleoside diphosphate kinase
MHATNHALVITAQDLQRLLPILEQDGTPSSELLDWELHRATVVPQQHVPADVVTMNSEVIYEDVATGVRRTVRVVYPKDADPQRGWISVLAPIGSALLGLRVGQGIEWRLPPGPRRIRVVALRYQPEARGDFHL